MSSDDKDLELAEQEQELPPEIAERKLKGALRTGYTTGTTATAATKAALYALTTGSPVEQVTITMPKGKEASLNVAWTRIEDGRVTCAVIKDGGDDPDATHGAEICSTVSFNESEGHMNIEGGKGVGRVTKPGLGLEIGKAAINPTPMKMLEQTIREVMQDNSKRGVDVVISVPKGEEISKKTDNPRLGILGGISILGTTGIVVPYSTASFAAAIRQSLDVAVAMGADTIVLTTGGRSEDFSKELFRSLPEHCFIQMGDFAGYSVRQCANKNLRRAIIAGFIGKLTKMAMGVKQTHVAGSHVDMEFMARTAAECASPPKVIEEIRKANTARHVSEIVRANNVHGYFDLICSKAAKRMIEYSKGALDLEVVMFEFDGAVIGRYSKG